MALRNCILILTGNLFCREGSGENTVFDHVTDQIKRKTGLNLMGPNCWFKKFEARLLQKIATYDNFKISSPKKIIKFGKIENKPPPPLFRIESVCKTQEMEKISVFFF